jgi:pimeloyl-ACP methyl ester carboxylesterase
MRNLPPLLTGDGLRLAAKSAGSGPVQVLVPNGAYFLAALAPVWVRHPAVAVDLRNRGGSDPVADTARLARGVLNDVDDLEAARTQLGLERMDLVAHSYVGVVAVLYAIAHPGRVRRLVLLSPAPPDPAACPAPPPDATMTRVFTRLAELQQTPPPGDAEARCRAIWAVLKDLYVADPALAAPVAAWGRCHLPNERSFMGYWATHVEPSLRRAAPSDAALGRVTCPVLVVHGTADRSAPYEGGRAWARRLPDARLLALEGAAHAPWIERPAVIAAIRDFLDGTWPEAAVAVGA